MRQAAFKEGNYEVPLIILLKGIVVVISLFYFKLLRAPQLLQQLFL